MFPPRVIRYLALFIIIQAAIARGDGFVLISQPPPKPNVTDHHLIVHYIDSHTGKIAYLGDVPPSLPQEMLGFMKADYANNRLICGFSSTDRASSVVRLLEFGAKVRVRDFSLPRTWLMDAWLTPGRHAPPLLAAWAFDMSDKKTAAAPQSGYFAQVDLTTSQIAKIDKAPVSSVFGGRDELNMATGPYLWFRPANGTVLTDDPTNQFANRPHLSVTLDSAPPADLCSGREESSWYLVGDPHGDFALVERCTEGRQKCRMLIYRQASHAWSWTDLDGNASRAILMGHFVVFEEARTTLCHDSSGRTYLGPDQPTGRHKIVRLDAAGITEVSMDDSRVLAVDHEHVLIKSGRELWLLTHAGSKITAKHLLATRDVYFDLCLYGFPVPARPTSLQLHTGKNIMAEAGD